MGMAVPGSTTVSLSGLEIRDIEVVHPGYAYTWTEGATGLRIRTNLKPADCNRRNPEEGIVYFKTDKALWGWAQRVLKATQ